MTDTVTDDRRDAPSRELARTHPWTHGDGTLTWAEVTAFAPALGRTVVHGGRRVVDDTAAVTRSALASLAEAESPREVWVLGRERVVASLRTVLGIDEIETRLRRLTVLAAAPVPAPTPPPAPAPVIEPEPEPLTLRERAQLLLDAPAVTEDADGEHPAFALVLAELAADELRLLRVLAADGDQPLVDVVARGPLGGNERVVAEGLTLLADAAGCAQPARFELHRDNLLRLGLAREGDEPVEDADHEALEALAREHPARGGGSVRLRRRRLGLTPFGRAFAADCLPR